MSGMADVLATHTPVDATTDGVPEDEIWCNNIECGFKMKRTNDYDETQDFAAHQAAALSAAGFGPVNEARESLAQVTDLVRDLIDPDDCSFDHHGGCQAHGYLELQPGELCPQLEAKAWLHNREARNDDQ